MSTELKVGDTITVEGKSYTITRDIYSNIQVVDSSHLNCRLIGGPRHNEQILSSVRPFCVGIAIFRKMITCVVITRCLFLDIYRARHRRRNRNNIG
jgi:hypothetical protein